MLLYDDRPINVSLSQRTETPIRLAAVHARLSTCRECRFQKLLQKKNCNATSENCIQGIAPPNFLFWITPEDLASPPHLTTHTGQPGRAFKKRTVWARKLRAEQARVLRQHAYRFNRNKFLIAPHPDRLQPPASASVPFATLFPEYEGHGRSHGWGAR